MANIPSEKTMHLIYPKSFNARPHVTTEYDDSALTNQASESAKNIYLLGSATEGNPNNVYEVKSSQQARAIFGSGDLVNAMEMIWNPDGDFFQNGGTVYAKRVENAEQASLVEGPLTITSKIYGASANKIEVSLAKDAISNAYNLRVRYDPKEYTNNYTNIGNIAEIYYGGHAATANAYGYKVEGSDARATKFTLATGDSANDLHELISFDLTKQDYNTMEKLLVAIGKVPGFQATIVKPCAPIPTSYLDFTPTTGDGVVNGFVKIGNENNPNIISAFYGDLKYTVRNDPYITIDINRFGKPTNVTATPNANGVETSAQPNMIDLKVFEDEQLSGGTDGHVPVSWADQFPKVHGNNVYYIVPLTAEENVHAELEEFLNEENILGYNYMAFVGGGYNEDLNTILNRQINLRSNRIALVANSGTYTSLNGQEIHIPAYMMAAYVAGIASSEPIGHAVTNKYLELDSLDQNFDGSELDTLDQNGVIAIEDVVNRNASGGFRIVEDVTTYNSTNEKVKNLVSLQELTDFLFDDLRIYLEENFIGAPVTTTTGALINTFIEAFLQKQVKNGQIAKYDRSSIQTTVSGNQAWVSFSCSPAQEMRQIVVEGVYTNLSYTTSSSTGTFSGNGVNPDTTSVEGLEAQNEVQTHYVDE